jgi:hypothetical protein
MKKLLVPSLIVLLAFLNSCSDENQIRKKAEYNLLSIENETAYKRSFAVALSKAIVSDKNVRDFLRQEALQMFDGDYDVLYGLVKNKEMENGKTLEETLSAQFESIEDLKKIEAALPLLTVFVPTLPEGSFSAEQWETSSQIPFVSMRLSSTNDIPTITPEGKEFVMDADVIPAFPVIVIKDNERMQYNGQPGYGDLKSSRKFSNGEREYKFLDDIFDQEISKTPPSLRKRTSVDSKLISAYNIYSTADGWHRDLIYYGITPTSPNGQFSYDFVETVTYFKFVGDPWLMYAKINDQTPDPGILRGKESSGWADGYYEIRFVSAIQAKNGIGASISNSFASGGGELFEVTYNVERRGTWPFRYDYYTIKTITALERSVNAPIVAWDLANYAPSFRIDVEEVDNTTEVTEQYSETVKFAMNFEVDGTVLEKIGLKFGATTGSDRTTTITKKTMLGSDDLGHFVVNFADKVVTSRSSVLGIRYYNLRDYTNDFISIGVEPKRVQ